MVDITGSWRDMERVEGDGLDEYILTEASPTPSPFRFGGLGGGGLWDDVEVSGEHEVNSGRCLYVIRGPFASIWPES